MTPECGRCGSKSIAHVNGVGRQCLMCGQEHGQSAQDAAFVAGVDADQVKDARVMNLRSASRALEIPYTTLLQWVRLGALPATPWDPLRSRRGRIVRLADVLEIIASKMRVTCAECGATTFRTFLPRGVPRRFCPPPAKCSSQWHERHRERRSVSPFIT